MNHPNLSDEINANLAKSEILGGVWLTLPGEYAAEARKEASAKGNVLAVGKSLRVQTRNTLYLIEKRGESDFWISGHAKYCPVPIKTNIHGSTFGGSMLKMGYVGRDMHLEFSVPGHDPITTSAIQNITEYE